MDGELPVKWKPIQEDDRPAVDGNETEERGLFQITDFGLEPMIASDLGKFLNIDATLFHFGGQNKFRFANLHSIES